MDRQSVGQIIDIFVKNERVTRPDLHVGIWGENEEEPSSFEWWHMIWLNYVSYSSFRISVARIATTQIQITHPRKWFYFLTLFCF